MRRFALIISILICHTASAEDSLLIENVTIISPQLESPLQYHSVLIANGRVKTISHTPLDTSPATQVLDGRGLYLVPGIMDSHVHVSAIPGMGFGVEPVARAHPKLAQAYYQQQPRSFLYHGVTQVLDPNPGLHWQQFTAAPQHPDYFRCEVITSPNSFPLVEKSDAISQSMFPYVIDEAAEPGSSQSPEHVVQRIRDSGARCIKLYFEDGYGAESHWPLFTEAILRRIRAAATAHQLPVLAHANALDMYQQAIAAEVDVIAHGMWNWGDDARETEITAAIQQTLDAVKAKHIGYMASQRVIAGLGELMLEHSADPTAFKNITPPALLTWYQTPAAQWFKQELRSGFDDLPDQIIARIFLQDRVAKGAKVLQAMAKSHYPLLLGSDFPGSPSYANQPGLTSYLEMKMMAEAGISLSEILAAATVNNARQFQLDQDYGTVEPGKVANLLLLQQNPLESIEAWNGIHRVILHGQVFSREELAVTDDGTQDAQQH